MIFGSDLVEEVARQIAQTIGMPATEIRLQLGGGHALDMQNTVRSYGIQRDSVIFASLRLRGGVRRLGDEGAAAPAPDACSKPQHKLEKQEGGGSGPTPGQETGQSNTGQTRCPNT